MSRTSWWWTEIGEAEKARLLSAFDGRLFSLGDNTAQFEKDIAVLLEVPYAVATNSGTAALTMALMASGVGPGDEVIVPDLTWIATANAASVLGAKVVLVDCLPDLPLIDPTEVKNKVTTRTKAIIPVHLNGRSSDIEQLQGIARDADVALIEDACKALASRSSGGFLGTLGDIGCYSLGMISLVSTGYGGVVVTRDEGIYEMLKMIRNQGVPPVGEERYETVGFNFKFSDLLAAIGIVQLSRLNEKLEHINLIYQRYVDGLASLPYIDVIPVNVASGEVPLCAEVRSRYRDELIAYLDHHGVGALNFHLPLHAAAHLRNGGNFPNATSFSNEGFILPCGPSQPIDNVDRCIELLNEWNAYQ